MTLSSAASGLKRMYSSCMGGGNSPIFRVPVGLPSMRKLLLKQQMAFVLPQTLLKGRPLSLANPMRGDVKRKTLPCSPVRGSCSPCIQPNLGDSDAVG